MSTPIRECDYYPASVNEEAYNLLVENAMQPIYSVIQCNCQPECRKLNEEEKQILQKRVNDRIAEIRLENRIKSGMSLQDLCGFVSAYIKHCHGKDATAEQVYNLSPTRSMSDYLDMYEEAVYNMGRDFFGRTAITYFEERVQMTSSDPSLRVISARYQNTLAVLEKKKNV